MIKLNIKYKIISLTEENINLLEKIRFNAYGIDEEKMSHKKSFYINDLKSGKYLVIGAFLEEILVAACYTKNTYHSLYIDQLFVLKKYQKTPLHIGSNLLKYILDNHKIIEEYFQEKFHYSYLDDYRGTKDFYQNLGYIEKENLMKRHL